MAKISVIIPVYNVENYLGKCLDSIINQTFKDIEIICVNDGSKDNSLKILQEYAQKDSRIKVINNENGGPSLARNSALDMATSEWIAFVDSDDWLDLNAFEELEKITELNPDVICFGTHLRGETEPEIAKADAEYYSIKHSGFLELTDDIRETTDAGIWNKIYKKSIIDKFNLRFPIGKHYEDYIFNWEYLFESKTAFYTKEKFYNYLRHPNSIMANTFNKKSDKVIDHLYASEIILDYCRKRGILEEHLKVFAEIFMNCFWFSYNNSPKNKRKSVLLQSTILLNKFALDNDFNDKWNTICFLKAGQYYKIEPLNYDKNIWQKIFSIKKRNGRKRVKVLGMTFSFKYKTPIDERLDYLNQVLESQRINIENLMNLLKKQDENITNLSQIVNIEADHNEYNLRQFTYFQNIEYETAYSEWITYGATPELCDRLAYLSKSGYQWEIQCNELWLIYLCCLVETNDHDKALWVLKKYVDKHGYKDIERYILAADFAYRNGCKNEDIEKAHCIYQKLEENRKNKAFEKLIEGKSIAIVGNGPSEISKGKGKEIDSHDIVIRFNNYQTEGFEEDYGSKTDIWVRGFGGDDLKDYTAVNSYLFAGITGDYMHMRFLWNFQIDILYRDIMAGIATGNISPDIFRQTLQKYPIDPSTGFSTICALTQFPGIKLDIYGFSFLQEIEDGYATHYFNDREEAEAKKRSLYHSFNKESIYLKELFHKEIKEKIYCENSIAENSIC